MAGHEILTVAEAYEADRNAIDGGVDGVDLVLKAGAAIALAIQQTWSPRPVSVLCGPGLNGADGLDYRHRVVRGSGAADAEPQPPRGEPRPPAMAERDEAVVAGCLDSVELWFAVDA